MTAIFPTLAAALEFLAAVRADCAVNCMVLHEMTVSFPPGIAAYIVTKGFALTARQMLQRLAAMLAKLLFLLFPLPKGLDRVGR